LAGLFLYASFGKLAEPEGFARTIEDFGLVYENVLFAAALALIVLEFCAGLGLLLDVRGALGLTVGLLLLFVCVLGYGIAMGYDIHCECFGPGDREVGLHEALYRDLALLAACGYLYWSRWMRATGPLSLLNMWTNLRKKLGVQREWKT
jgi:hypothetical protein